MSSLRSWVEAFVAWFDLYQRRHGWLAFIMAVIKKYNDDEAGHRAALLAYYGFLSIFPLLLVLASIFKLLLRNQTQLGSQLAQGATTYFPAIGQALQQNIHGIDHTGLALILGILLSLFGARGVGDVLRSSLDHVWQIPYARRSQFPMSLFRTMAVIIVGGLTLAVAPVLSGYMLTAGHHWFTGPLSTIFIATAIFWVIVYGIKVGASTYRPFKQIWLGALIAAGSFEILQSLGGIIVTHELQRLDTLYGTFALILGLIFWLYLQTQVLLFALELDTVRVFKLWPRSFSRSLTAADHEAYELYMRRADFRRTLGS